MSDKPTIKDFETKLCASILQPLFDMVWEGLGEVPTGESVRLHVGAMPVDPSDDAPYAALNGSWTALTPALVDVQWGDIGGTLSDQDDLQTVLDAKLEDAPEDGTAYTRQDAAWEPLPAGLTGIHNDQTERDAADCHPIAATTGLQAALDNVYTKAETDAALEAQFPVGSIQLVVGAQDPNTYLPGTWAKTALGRVLIGVGTLGSDTYTAGDEGGEARHTLVKDELATHAHGTQYEAGTAVAGTSVLVSAEDRSNTAPGPNTTTSGSDQPHENRPPYLAVNIWERTV